MSLRRQNRWMLSNVSALSLFGAGMAILPAYLLQSELPIRFAQVLLFGALARVAGKRLQWIYFLSIMATITVFHLIVPSGAVLVEIGSFPVTLGALRTGVFKALTIVGLVFVSLVSVRADLRLPGRAGAVAAKVFWSFERIMERRSEMSVRAPFRSADRLLTDVYDDLLAMDDRASDTAGRKGTATRSSGIGRAAVASIVLLQWLVLVPAFIGRTG